MLFVTPINQCCSWNVEKPWCSELFCIFSLKKKNHWVGSMNRAHVVVHWLHVSVLIAGTVYSFILSTCDWQFRGCTMFITVIKNLFLLICCYCNPDTGNRLCQPHWHVPGFFKVSLFKHSQFIKSYKHNSYTIRQQQQIHNTHNVVLLSWFNGAFYVPTS